RQSVTPHPNPLPKGEGAHFRCRYVFQPNCSQEDPMDLNFTKEEIAFRDEVRAFFRDNVPPSTRQKLQEGRHLGKQEMIDWWRILNKKGWGVSHWPKEY